jgi:lipoate---protein ligase
MYLYPLGRVPWQESQLAYHALASLGRESLVLCSPARPYVSVGYFQDPSQELDLEHCRWAGLPIFRRKVGGGCVYLDRNQIFWQVVLKRDNPLVSLSRQKFYDRLLAPVAAVYRRLGVEASIKPVNDLAVRQKRIAGTGAGEIGDCVVFVGNIMRCFDCAAMAEVVNAPDPAFRRSFHHCLETQLTSLRVELGREIESRIEDHQIYKLLVNEFAKVIGPMEPRPVDHELRRAMAKLGRRMLSRNWTYHPRKMRPFRKLKVRAGLFLHHWEKESSHGRLKAQFTSLEGKVVDIHLQGPWGDLDKEQNNMTRNYLGQDIGDLQKYLVGLAA